MRQHRIILVDDDPLILKAMGAALEDRGYAVTAVSSGEDAADLLKDHVFDVVITDLVMANVDGIALLEKIRAAETDTAVIILTGHGDLPSAIEALRLRADDYVLKPCETEEMFFRVDQCIQRLEIARKLKAYEDILPIFCICKKIRDDTGKEPGSGKWLKVEEYVCRRGGVHVTSTYCPECYRREQAKLDEL